MLRAFQRRIIILHRIAPRALERTNTTFGDCRSTDDFEKKKKKKKKKGFDEGKRDEEG